MKFRDRVAPGSRIFPTVLAVALLGLSAGCASTLGPMGSAEVASQGLSEARLARIAPSMKAEIDRGMFPGAVTMVAP